MPSEQQTGRVEAVSEASMSWGLAVVVVCVAHFPLWSFATTWQGHFHLEREAAARKWSPLVWLHPEENYFPSAVPFFLQHVTPSRDEGRAVVQQGLTAPNLSLPSGRPSQNYYLLASHNFGCLDCTVPQFLQGQKPQKYSPPVYATIHTCSPMPSARAARSTQNSLGVHTNDQAEAVITSSSHKDNKSTFSTSNSTLQHETSFPLSSHTHSLPSVPYQSHQTPPEQMYSTVSTVGETNPLNISYDVNTNTTFLCADNETFCPVNTNVTNTMMDDQVNEDARNLSHRDLELRDNLLMNTSEITFEDESDTMVNSTELLNSSLIRLHHYSTQINDTNGLENTKKLTPVGQYHNNEERHTRKSTHEDQSFEQQYTVTYWMFYPYNNGKKICTVNLGFFLGRMLKPKVNGMCHGEEITVGNHVGDWEHISIQFSGSEPRNMYVSAHNFGAYYKYDSRNHKFIYEGEDTREGIPLSPDYPRTVHFTQNHPILYSAKGSHGLWGAEGIHRYNSLPALEDETGKGTPWKTWKNLIIIDAQNPTSVQPHRHWWQYEGRWGNPSSKCHVLLAGFCENVKGPTGIPRKRVNFPCTRNK